MGLLDALATFFGSYAATVAMGCACSYLGLFTVLRRIVFTGVALAQLAAAGVAGAFFVADHPATPRPLADLAARHGATVGSLGLALLGALGLQARPSQKRVAPDAVVGIAYAAASALAILLVWRSARGLSELRDILAGEVLLAREGERLWLWVGLAAVAIVHAARRREFLLVSFDPEFARAMGAPERRHQRLLLVTLAVAVALSLKAGGLLLVFSFLVLPPAAGLVLGRTLDAATWLALAIAAGSSLLGFLLAIGLDLPVAPTIAAAQLALLGLAGLGQAVPAAAPALRGAILALGAAALVALPAAWLAQPARQEVALGGHHHHHGPGPLTPAPIDVGPAPPRGLARALDDATHALEAPSAAARRAAIDVLAGLGPVALEPLLLAVLDEEPEVRAAALAAIARLDGGPLVVERLADHAAGDEVERRVPAARALAALGDPRGLEALVRALTGGEVPFVQAELALDVLVPLTGGQDFGFDPFADEAARAAAAAAWTRWWRDVGAGLRWDPAARAFR